MEGVGTHHHQAVGAEAAAGAERPAPPQLDASAVAARWRAVTAATVAADLLAVGAAYALAGAISGFRPPELNVLAVTVVVWLAIFASYGLYDRSRLADASKEARRLFHGVTVSVVAVAMTAFALDLTVSRGWIGALWLASLVTVGGVRIVARHRIHDLQARGVIGAGTIVVGANDEGRAIARTLGRQQWLGYRPVGFVATAPVATASLDDLPVLGTIDDLGAVLDATGARSVVVAASAVDAAAVQALHRRLLPLDVELRVTAGLPLVAASRVSVEPLDGLPVLAFRRSQLSGVQAAMKRALDLVVASVLLVAIAPVLAALALAVRAGGGGTTVLFRQRRVGEGGRSFVIYKFRSMVEGAEDRVIDLRDRNDADGLLFKVHNDPRVTAVGRVLRRWGFDELPQLWNVLRGDMSLVGPRPPLPEEAARYDEWIRGRLHVKPGLTGLWQVNGRHELSFADYVRYDLFYVENWSLGLDLYVIARTLPALLSRRGAH